MGEQKEKRVKTELKKIEKDFLNSVVLYNNKMEKMSEEFKEDWHEFLELKYKLEQLYSKRQRILDSLDQNNALTKKTI